MVLKTNQDSKRTIAHRRTQALAVISNSLQLLFPGLAHGNSILPSGYVDLDVNRFVRSPMMSNAYNTLLTFELACPRDTRFFVFLVNSLGVMQSKLTELCRESTVDDIIRMFFEVRSVCVPAGQYSVAFIGSPSDPLPIYLRNIKLTSDDCVANSRMNISEEQTTGSKQSFVCTVMSQW